MKKEVVLAVLAIIIALIAYFLRNRRLKVKVKAYHFEKYDLIIGQDATEIFNYYDVTEMHSLSLDGAISRIVEGGPYIYGLANYHPQDKKLDMKVKPFIFLNLSALINDYESDEIYTAIMHETMHMAAIIYHYDLKNYEEQMITWAEYQANIIVKQLKKDRYI